MFNLVCKHGLDFMGLGELNCCCFARFRQDSVLKIVVNLLRSSIEIAQAYASR